MEDVLPSFLWQVTTFVTTIAVAHGKVTACVSDNTLLGQAGK